MSQGRRTAWDISRTEPGTRGRWPGPRAGASSGRRASGGTGSRRTARPGRAARGGFAAESGRYHLYVSLACPWAHRTLIFRELKGLAEHVSVDVVHPFLGEDGWSFATDFPGATGDRVLGKRLPARGLPGGGPEGHRQGHDAGALGQGDGARSSRTSPPRSSGCSTRRSTASPATRSTSGPSRCAPAIEAVNARVYDTREQRRLPRRLRPQPGGLRRGGDRALRDARLAGGAAAARALPDGRPADRGGLAARDHALPLRSRSITGTSS